jgi:rhodanese-related sulfurtransferase
LRDQKGITMKKYIISSLVVLSLAVAPHLALAGEPAWMSTPVKEMVDKARAATKQVPLEEFKGAVDRKEDAVILDVRNPDEYSVAHVPGAVNLSRGLLEFNIWNVIPDKNRKIYVYCKTGGRAALATKQLNELGYKNAVAVREGLRDWIKAGYPTKTMISDEDVVISLAK